MKKKIVFIFSLLFLMISSQAKVSRSNIKRAKNLVKGAPLYYEQTVPHLNQYLRSIGFYKPAKEIEQTFSEIKNQEAMVEAELQSKLSESEKKALATDRNSLEMYRILMNAKVPDDINRVFNTLENIKSNVEKDVLDLRKMTNTVAPRKLQIDKKIVQLQKEIAALQKEKQILLAEIEPKLEEYDKKIKRGGESLLNQTKRIGMNIKNKSKVEFQQVDGLQKKIEALKKERVNPETLQKLDSAKKAKLDLFKKTIDQASRMGQAEMIRLASILDLLSHIELTTNVILNGPGEIKKWDLKKDILKIEDLNGSSVKQQSTTLPATPFTLQP